MNIFGLSEQLRAAKETIDRDGLRQLRNQRQWSKVEELETRLLKVMDTLQVMQVLLAKALNLDEKQLTNLIDRELDRLEGMRASGTLAPETVACQVCGRPVNVALRNCQICGGSVRRT